MAEEASKNPESLEHASVNYERTDASFRWVLGLLLAAGALAVIIYLAILGLFVDYRSQLDEERRSRYPLAPGPRTELPPEPRLEQLDRKEGISPGQSRQKAQWEQLHRYGETGEAGFVHIPIERAMKLVAGKLPVRKEKKEGAR
jgi:hypothetical protein